ncbi:MAG: dehydrogenase [candidate division NC10 bacterium RIFCSPLOWO2_12_FULL_66_18]|nr:MAG: dehydrogenase [candidate division NC10 bacterium RIFCSPLOWO2_02_FULL_66_22]OGB98653.1 MAG: dehydrogenase [candidate division NC10 bacterium RIFCSPLOWO2_12_FULL_66_18]
MATTSPITLGIGVLGYAGVAKAHLNALKKLPYIFWPSPVRFRLLGVGGRSLHGVEDAARRYGFEYGTTEWRRLVDDPRVGLFINCAPNDVHAESCLAAAGEGKHLLCEKPLARDAREARRMWEGVRRDRIQHQVSFNYRFVPAVRLAREMIQAGDLGEIIHFRTRYTDDTLADPATPHTWRQEKRRAGSGAVGDIASHVLDLARFLVGELREVAGLSRIAIPRRPVEAGSRRTMPVDVEDLYEGLLEFANGAVGTLEVSTLCLGRKNYLTFEVNGTKGSLCFNLERLNELEVFRAERGRRDRGFKTVLVTDGDHPYGGTWWPPGHILGWEHTFVHQLHHLVKTIIGQEAVAPLAADFHDGYINAVLCEALLQAARTGKRVRLKSPPRRPNGNKT